MVSCSRGAVISFLLAAGMMVAGTTNTIARKLQNSQTAPGITGQSHAFSKPWFQTLIMFMGEMLCLLYYAGEVIYERRKQARIQSMGHDESRTLLSASNGVVNTNYDDRASNEPAPPKVCGCFRHNPLLLLPPACLDVIGTSLGGIGLLFTTASVYQMLRGSIIIFSGIFSVIFLKRKLNVNNWLGILVTTGGIVLVGYASLLDQSQGTTSNLVLLGDALIILGQLCSAAQFIVEEVLLKSRKLPPPLVVGGEGVYGFILMMGIVLPVCYAVPGQDAGNRYENFIDAFVMIGQNGMLLAMVLLYILSIAFYNLLGMQLTKRLTAVHRTFIDALRTVFVWGVQLIIFYTTAGVYGEKWDSHSYIQLIGFALMVLGTVLYNQVLSVRPIWLAIKRRMPCCNRCAACREDDDLKNAAAAVVADTSAAADATQPVVIAVPLTKDGFPVVSGGGGGGGDGARPLSQSQGRATSSGSYGASGAAYNADPSTAPLSSSHGLRGSSSSAGGAGGGGRRGSRRLGQGSGGV